MDWFIRLAQRKFVQSTRASVVFVPVRLKNNLWTVMRRDFQSRLRDSVHGGDPEGVTVDQDVLSLKAVQNRRRCCSLGVLFGESRCSQKWQCEKKRRYNVLHVQNRPWLRSRRDRLVTRRKRISTHLFIES